MSATPPIRLPRPTPSYVRQRDAAKEAYAAAAKALSERRAREDEIQRQLGALPHLAALREAESECAPLADLAVAAGRVARRDRAAPGRGDQARGAEGERRKPRSARLRTSSSVLAQILRRLRSRIGSTAGASCSSRYDSAADIPVRQGELDGKRDAVADILRRLGREGEADPLKLPLPVRVVGALEDLIAARSGVLSKLEAARRSGGGGAERAWPSVAGAAAAR